MAWRIVGNEFRQELARRASKEIAKLCDFDEWEKAVEAFDGGGTYELGEAPDRDGTEQLSGPVIETRQRSTR